MQLLPQDDIYILLQYQQSNFGTIMKKLLLSLLVISPAFGMQPAGSNNQLDKKNQREREDYLWTKFEKNPNAPEGDELIKRLREKMAACKAGMEKRAAMQQQDSLKDVKK